MGGQNPQDMFKRGMPMLGQVPGAVKKGPLGQLHKDTSEFISPTPEPKASFDKVDEFGNPPGTIEGNVISPDEQEFIDAQKVDEQLAQQKEYKSKLIPATKQKEYEPKLTPQQENLKKIKMIDKMKTIDDEYTYYVEEPLETVEDAYREMMIKQLKNYYKDAFKPEKYSYTTKDLELIYSNIPADFGVKSPSVKGWEKGEWNDQINVALINDKVHLVKQLRKLNPKEFGAWADEQHGWPLESLQTQFRKEMIGKLDDYWSGTKYPSDKNYFDDLPLDALVMEYNTMIFDQSEIGGGKEKASLKDLSSDTFTNPVDKPAEVSPLKKLAQSRLGLGAKIIENIPVAKALQALKKVREAVKKVRYLKKNRELQKANIERQRGAEEDFGDYGFKLGDVQKHLTRAAEIPKMRTVTKEQLEKENAPDEWDTEEVSGPFNIQRRTREEKALNDKLYNHPVLKRLLSQDINTPQNRALRRLKLKKLGDGNAVLTDEQKKYLIKKFDEKGTILGSQQDVDEWTQFMPPNVMPRREVLSQEAARRIRSEGRIPKYRIPLFDSEGNVIVDEKSPGAFQRYPKKIWQHGRFQRPVAAASGAVYSSDSVLTSS